MTSLKIENNYSAYINGIYQYAAYAGLLEGLPTRSMNREIMKDAVETAPNYTHETAVHLIEPIEHPLEYDGQYPFGQPATLPPIVCIVRLKSLDVFRDSAMDYSVLTVVWFQEKYAFPIDPLIIEQIEQIPWSQVAQEYEY